MEETGTDGGEAEPNQSLLGNDRTDQGHCSCQRSIISHHRLPHGEGLHETEDGDENEEEPGNEAPLLAVARQGDICRTCGSDGNRTTIGPSDLSARNKIDEGNIGGVTSESEGFFHEQLYPCLPDNNNVHESDGVQTGTGSRNTHVASPSYGARDTCCSGHHAVTPDTNTSTSICGCSGKMAQQQLPPIGDISMELHTAPTSHFQSGREALVDHHSAKTRLDYGDSAFCYGSIDSRQLNPTTTTTNTNPMLSSHTMVAPHVDPIITKVGVVGSSSSVHPPPSGGGGDVVKEPLEGLGDTLIQCAAASDVIISSADVIISSESSAITGTTITGGSEVTTTNSDMLDDDSEPCGWGPLQPPWCQMFRNPKVFLFCLCWAGAVQGMIVNGFIGVVITTIERRFDLASTESGIIASAYDIASVLCLIPVSYYGGIGRKPQWLGFGIGIVGIGSFFFALPHFLTGLYDYESTRSHNQCHHLPLPQGSTNNNNNGGYSQLQRTSQQVSSMLMMSLVSNTSTSTNSMPSSATTTKMVCEAQAAAAAQSGLSSYKYMFILAQLLHGAGAAPLYTLGVTFLDENLKPKVTPVYVGVFYAMAIIGPALGYLMGGEFLKRYTDIWSVDVTRLEITPESPKWVGAWWVGFLITSTLALIISVPMIGFPRTLPGAARLRLERVSEAYSGTEPLPVEPGFGKSFRDIFTSLKVLITNPTFMFLNCAGASEGLLLGGFTAFAPKFIESQFSISAGLAAQLVGFAMIPAGGGGTLLGAYLVKKFDLKCAGIIKLCMCTSFMSLVLTLVFFIRCPNVPFAGVNRDYLMPNRTIPQANLTSTCNADCHCIRTRYDPVCSTDGIMYFSPCYAGCKESTIRHSRKMFYNCSCLHPHQADQGASYTSMEGQRGPYVVEGKCQSDCQLLALFLPAFALVVLTTFCTSMPALSATLRCVPDRQRSFALGIQWILVRCLGTVPAPIFFGAMIDKTCRLWQKPCMDRGSCLVYDNNTMGRYLLAMVVCGKGVAFLFFMLAGALYRPPPKKTQLSVMPEEAMSSNSTVQMFLKDGNKVPVETAGGGGGSSGHIGATASATMTKSGIQNPALRQTNPSMQARYKQLVQ